MEIEMKGVREYSEGYPVSLSIDGGALVVHAINQGGYDCTNIDVLDLLIWLRDNAQQYVHLTGGILPDLLNLSKPKSNPAPETNTTPPASG